MTSLHSTPAATRRPLYSSIRSGATVNATWFIEPMALVRSPLSGRAAGADTLTHYNQAGALVLLYTDGTAQVNHGGTEMGQGLQTKIQGVAMRELGLPAGRVRVMPTTTDKVPNTSATAASSGADLNGAAVRNACATLRKRLLPVAAALLSKKAGRKVPESRIGFAGGKAAG